MLTPAVYTIILSFQEWNLLTEPKWVGLSNYIKILTRPTMVRAILNSLTWILGTLVFGAALALLLAQLVDSYKSKIVKGLFTIVFVAPFTFAPTTMSKIWINIFNSEGAINATLEAIGLGAITRSWLSLTQPLIPGLPIPISTVFLILVLCWRILGLNYLLFLITLESIPPYYSEAARLDGANEWQIFWKVKFPLLKPVTLLVIAKTIINSWRMFSIPWVMTQGGPGRATETLAVSMYRESLLLFDTGMGAAIAVFIAISSLFLSMRWLGGFTT